LREHNQDADRLANEAMDKGMGRGVVQAAAASSAARPSGQPQRSQEFEGIVRNGAVELSNGALPEGTRVQVRVKK